jgi:hypothetical protein
MSVASEAARRAIVSKPWWKWTDTRSVDTVWK